MQVSSILSGKIGNRGPSGKGYIPYTHRYNIVRLIDT